MGSPKESLEQKNIFTEKYDEIRRLDGTVFLWIRPLVAFYSYAPELVILVLGGGGGGGGYKANQQGGIRHSSTSKERGGGDRLFLTYAMSTTDGPAILC
jgi:hypothetical protein